MGQGLPHEAQPAGGLVGGYVSERMRLRVEAPPDSVMRTATMALANSRQWARRVDQPEGLSRVYYGEAGERAVVYPNEVRLDRLCPRVGPGYHPYFSSQVLNTFF